MRMCIVTSNKRQASHAQTWRHAKSNEKFIALHGRFFNNRLQLTVKRQSQLTSLGSAAETASIQVTETDTHSHEPVHIPMSMADWGRCHHQEGLPRDPWWVMRRRSCRPAGESADCFPTSSFRARKCRQSHCWSHIVVYIEIDSSAADPAMCAAHEGL